MARMIKWPDIEQFRSTVHNVVHSAHYIGKDENGDPMYDTSRTKPVLRFEGSVKLHGTNAAVCMAPDGEMWCQSRENIITPLKDNAGFAMFVEARREELFHILNKIYDCNIDRYKHTIAIFGEFAGKGIQQGVAISEIPKSFFIFGVKVIPVQPDLSSYYFDLTRIVW